MVIFLSGDTPTKQIEKYLLKKGNEIVLSSSVAERSGNDGNSREGARCANAAILYLSTKEKIGIGDHQSVFSAGIPGISLILEKDYLKGIPTSVENMTKIVPIRNTKEIYSAINLFLRGINIQTESERRPFKERF